MYKENFGNIPNSDKIKYYLNVENPSPWSIRSLLIAKSAKNMAKELGLDPDIAYAAAGLHDIGKYNENPRAKKLLEGFHILRNDSYFFVARIAISQAFIIKDVDSFDRKDLITKKEREFIKNFLYRIDYNDYDRLVQLLSLSIDSSYLSKHEIIEKIKSRDKDSGFLNLKIEKIGQIEDYFQKKLKYPIKDYCK